MLTTLRIKNLALVSDLVLELRPGFNAITGETGAGKSIIIGALNLVLGERADRSLIRSGAEQCSVEAVFEVAGRIPVLEKFLEENGLEPCADDVLILKRVFTAAGSNRQFVNGSPTTLQILAALGQHLVDMHGPHEHQSLLHPAKQLRILDALGGLEPLRQKFSGTSQQWRTLQAEKAALIVDERTYAQQLDLLRHQVQEIAAARLQPEEEVQLEQEFQRASNAARLLELAQAALNLLSEQDNSMLAQAGELGRTLHNLQRIDPSVGAVAAAHEQAVANLRELQAGLRNYLDTVELDPARLQEIQERLSLLYTLKRKYGNSLAEVIAFGDEARRKLESLEGRDAELARLNTESDRLHKELCRIGQELSSQRRKTIPKLAKATVKELRDLGFQQSQFDVSIHSSEPRATAEQVQTSGFDEIDFQFAPNPGEPAKPLRAIASSGEMSRVMLALKTVLAAQDEIPVLVFDEIDANVGGETAAVVGQKMLQIAGKRQVLCITHLPPVAASASTHFVVNKRVEEGRTISEIKLLDTHARVTEIARMLGGQTEAIRKHAKELLK